MKIIIFYIGWFIVTTIWSALKDTDKNAVIFRFAFTFIITTLVVFWLFVRGQNEA